MKRIQLYERVWSAMAHVPLITMIWFGYITYSIMQKSAFAEAMASLKVMDASSLPVAPLVLTLASMPIVLAIRYFQRRSAFVKSNTDSAFHFNIWLLQYYAFVFIAAAVGMLIPSKIISGAAMLVGLAISSMCLAQCLLGVIVALGGEVYNYWYPLPAVPCLHILCRCSKAAKRKNTQKAKRKPRRNNAV